MIDVDADVDDDDDASNCYGLCCYVSILCVNGGQVTSAIKLKEKRSRPGLITHLPLQTKRKRRAERVRTESGSSRPHGVPHHPRGDQNPNKIEPERPTSRNGVANEDVGISLGGVV